MPAANQQQQGQRDTCASPRQGAKADEAKKTGARAQEAATRTRLLRFLLGSGGSLGLLGLACSDFGARKLSHFEILCRH